MKAYGVERFGGLLGLPKRVTYVIDKRGIIRLVSHHEFLIGRHIEDIVATLRDLE
jgi:peroxiredoxin